MRSGDLTESYGITYRQLDYWCRTGLIPGADHSHGRGHPRSFTPEQVALVRAMAPLVHAGIDPWRAREMAMDLAEGRPARIGDCWLIPEANLRAAGLAIAS